MCISFDKKYVNTYEIQCGNFLFHIHTHLKSINLNAFEQIIANPSIPNFEINIWIDKNIDMLHSILVLLKVLNLFHLSLLSFIMF